jgi:hypothetical protein
MAGAGIPEVGAPIKFDIGPDSWGPGPVIMPGKPDIGPGIPGGGVNWPSPLGGGVAGILALPQLKDIISPNHNFHTLMSDSGGGLNRKQRLKNK